MAKKCKECGAELKPNAKFCTSCGTPVKKKRSSATASREAAFGEFWVILVIIMYIVGTLFILGGFWIIGLPLIIAAGIFSANQESNMIPLLPKIAPRLSILLTTLSIGFIRVLPEHETISVFGFAIAWMSIILTLPESERKEGKKTNLFAGGSVLWIGIIGAITTLIWTLFVMIVIMNREPWPTSMIIASFTVGMVAASIVWKQPLTAGWKILLTVICFFPIILFGVNALFLLITTGLGGLMDQFQHMMTDVTGIGSTGTILDTILNPQAALAAGLKPASVTEVTETEGPPTIAFTVSGTSIPDSGCYNTSPFQMIGRVKNTGGVLIRDLKLRMEPDVNEITYYNDPCQGITESSDGPFPREWRLTSIPIGVTQSRNLIIEQINTPPSGDPQNVLSIFGLSEVGEEFFGLPSLDVEATHACFMDIIAETGYHSFTRLPIEFIESDYGTSKTEQRQLSPSERPSVTSTGPVELSLGGFEQPLFYYQDQTGLKESLITAISNVGNGLVSNYESAYLFIPNVLLNPVGTRYDCYNSNDKWECTNAVATIPDGTTDPILIGHEGTVIIDCSTLTDLEATEHCTNYINFWLNQRIGGYTQFEYDDSHTLVGPEYSICFYKDDISETGIITTGTCTLSIGQVMSANDLRKTLIIRGDVIYKYQVIGETSVTVSDCDI